MNYYSKFKSFHSRKCIWKYCLRIGGHFSRPQCVNCSEFDPDLKFYCEQNLSTKLMHWILSFKPMAVQRNDLVILDMHSYFFKQHYFAWWNGVENFNGLCVSYLGPTNPLINPLRAKFFRGNINIHLHFVSFLHIDTTQVVEILPQIRQ